LACCRPGRYQGGTDLPFAFQASVFSTGIGPALRAAQRPDASAVMINDHTAFRTDWMPFAGRPQPRYGIGVIRPTMNEMSEEKMLVFRQVFHRRPRLQCS
jgi:acyl-CoA reductase-like NAD-dependent aldehyde dehydrogenase